MTTLLRWCSCSDYETAGSLRTGHELVNRLISNVEWGMRGNFLDVPTDCPPEGMSGWGGPEMPRCFPATACYLADTYAFYKKYLFDLYQEQKDLNGMVPGDRACLWADEMFPAPGATRPPLSPGTYIVQRRCVSILEDQFDSMKDWVDYIRTVDGEHHGWRQMFHYGDWLRWTGQEPPRAMPGRHRRGYVADVYYAASADLLAKAADILGREGRGRRIPGACGPAVAGR